MQTSPKVIRAAGTAVLGHDLSTPSPSRWISRRRVSASPSADISVSHSVFGDETVHYHLADCDGNQHEINVPNGANFEANLNGEVKNIESCAPLVAERNKFRLNDNDGMKVAPSPGLQRGRAAASTAGDYLAVAATSTVPAAAHCVHRLNATPAIRPLSEDSSRTNCS